jgi:glutathione S-transferase
VKLWHCVNARSFRALWALEELGIPYELDVLPFPPRVFKKEYLAINRLGTVPYFIDGDTHLSESVAICLYLAHKNPAAALDLEPAHTEYGDFLNWLFHSDATLTFPQTIYFRYNQLEPDERKNPQVAEDYRKWYLARLRRLDAHIEGREFLCAGRFTVADIAIHYALFFGENLGFAGEYKPQVYDYLQRLKQRPGFIRAQQVQTDVTAQ